MFPLANWHAQATLNKNKDGKPLNCCHEKGPNQADSNNYELRQNNYMMCNCQRMKKVR